jgi:hypothetical protein
MFTVVNRRRITTFSKPCYMLVILIFILLLIIVTPKPLCLFSLLLRLGCRLLCLCDTNRCRFGLK